jgi:hypothetical protein
MYSSTLSLTSALDRVDGQRQDPASLPPGITRCPIHRELGGPQGRSGRMRKISPLRDFFLFFLTTLLLILSTQIQLLHG